MEIEQKPQILSIMENKQNQEKSEKNQKRKIFDDCILTFWSFLQRNRAERAQLRRCATPAEVFWEPAFYQLQVLLKEAGFSVEEHSLERLAVIAAVLSHITTIDPLHSSVAKILATEHQGKPRLSDLRFRKFLLIDEMPELMLALIRMVHLVGRSLPIPIIARNIMYWGEETKKRWAWDYYQVVLPSKQGKEEK